MCWQGPGGAVSCPRGWVARGLTDLGLTGPLVCCRSWAGSAQRGYVSGKAVGRDRAGPPFVCRAGGLGILR